jgi:uncharacterized protein
VPTPDKPPTMIVGRTTGPFRIERNDGIDPRVLRTIEAMNRRRPSRLLAGAVLVVLTTLGEPPTVAGQAPSSPKLPFVEAMGEGVITETPTLATATVGITTQSLTAREAMERNATTTQSVVKALRDSGLTAPDAIRTLSVSVFPVTEGKPDDRPRIVGYRASNQVEIRVTELTRLGPTLDAALAAGATDLGGPRFGLLNQRAAELRALEEAVRDARARVDAMAAALGKRVSRVVEVRTQEGQARPVMAETMATTRAGAPIPVEPGVLTIRARVLLRAELQ